VLSDAGNTVHKFAFMFYNYIGDSYRTFTVAKNDLIDRFYALPMNVFVFSVLPIRKKLYVVIYYKTYAKGSVRHHFEKREVDTTDIQAVSGVKTAGSYFVVIDSNEVLFYADNFKSCLDVIDTGYSRDIVLIILNSKQKEKLIIAACKKIFNDNKIVSSAYLFDINYFKHFTRGLDTCL